MKSHTNEGLTSAERAQAVAVTNSTAPRGDQRCVLQKATNSWGKPPALRALSRTAPLGFLPPVLGTPYSGSRGAREGAPLNSQPEPSGSPTPHLGGEQAPAPEESRRLPPRPRRARCQVSPTPPSPVRGRVPGAAQEPARAPHLPDPPRPPLAGAETAGRAGGGGTSRAVRLPRPPPASPASRGRRRPRVTLEPPPTQARSLGGRWLCRRLPLGPGGAKRRRSPITHWSGLARQKRKMRPSSLCSK